MAETSAASTDSYSSVVDLESQPLPPYLDVEFIGSKKYKNGFHSDGWLFGLPKNDNTVGPDAVKSCDQSRTLPLNREMLVEIAHVNSLTDFYVKLRHEAPMADRVKYALSSVMSFGCSDTYQHKAKDSRTHTAVMKTDITIWKRLKILEFLPENKVKVLFIDHGHEDIIQKLDLRILPKQYEMFPPMAFHCSMDILPPDGKDDWDEDLVHSLRHSLDGTHTSPETPGSQQLPSEGLRATCIKIKEDHTSVVLLHLASGEDWGTFLVNCHRARREGSNLTSPLDKPPFLEENVFPGLFGDREGSDFGVGRGCGRGRGNTS